MVKRSREASVSSTASSSDEDMSSAEDSPSMDAAAAPDSNEPDHPAKYAHFSPAAEPASNPTHSVMYCQLPPHGDLGFDSYQAYEIHYQQDHINRCFECEKNFPSDHYLNLHIAENHDPITAIRRERGEKTVSFQFLVLKF
jgi:hypothetical protein